MTEKVIPIAQARERREERRRAAFTVPRSIVAEAEAAALEAYARAVREAAKDAPPWPPAVV